MDIEHFTLSDPQGFDIFVYVWKPTQQARGIVQITHGAAEHAGRYERFGRALNDAGYLVYANDHRGHGKTAGTLEAAGIAGYEGWDGMVHDMRLLSEHIRHENPGLPLFLFGHSMGSFLSQQYIQSYENTLAGVILCGTTGSLGENLPQTIAALEQEAAQHGPHAPSMIFGQMFASFNAPFQPVKTGFEWLSRDQAEVQKYVDDPWCGFPFSTALVGDMLRGGAKIWTDAAEQRIPKTLPVLLIAGAMDPVGGFGTLVQQLGERYQKLGISDLTLKLYADARHEILNETNRNEVQNDIITWIGSHT